MLVELTTSAFSTSSSRASKGRNAASHADESYALECAGSGSTLTGKDAGQVSMAVYCTLARLFVTGYTPEVKIGEFLKMIWPSPYPSTSELCEHENSDFIKIGSKKVFF